MDKPTLSPQSNRLLDMCNGVLEGKNSTDELLELLEDMYSGLEKARGDFIKQVQKQGQDYVDVMQLEMDMVLAAFENYQAALDTISGYLETKNQKDIRQGMDMVIRATNEILDTLTVYESKSLQVGPTSFPVLNMLILLIDGYKQGSVPQEEFMKMINNAGQFFQKLLDEADEYKEPQGRSAIEMLKTGYNKFLDGLEELEEAAKTKDNKLFDKALAIIYESQEIIRNGYNKFNNDMFLSGPTESPITNLLISTLKNVREGIVPKEILEENLEKYQEHLDNMRMDMQGASFLPIEDNMIKDEVESSLDAIDIADEACDIIGSYLDTGDESELDIAIENLKESTSLLKKALTIFSEASEREGKISCLRCGALNEPANKNCVKCKAVLTKMPGQGSSTFAVGESGEIKSGNDQDFVMTENLLKLLQAVEKYVNGRIEYDEFDSTLKWMEKLLTDTLDESNNIPKINLNMVPQAQRAKVAKQMQVAEEAVALLQEGIEDFLEAIAVMRQAGIDEDMVHIREGVDLAIEASKKLQRVERMGEAARSNKAAEAPMAAGTSIATDTPLVGDDLGYTDELGDDAFISSSGSFIP
jgi:ribosomal protein L40E